MEHAATYPQLPRVRVLLVENEAESLAIYRRLLLSWGCEPIVAVGGGVELLVDAHAKAATYYCQVALVDMRLFDNRDKSDTSGLDLIAELRPTVSIVVSAFGNERTTRDALRMKGAFDFFSKGDDPSKLAELIQAASENACLCQHSGRIHWHPTSLNDRNGVVLSGLPTRAQPLDQFYQAAMPPQIVGVLRSVLQFFRGWQQSETPLYGALYDLYLGSAQETLVQRVSQAGAATALSWTTAWPEPLTWLAGHAAASVLEGAAITLCHGMLRLDQVVVDIKGEALLGNISRAVSHHRLYDMICLEIEIITRMLDLTLEHQDLLFELAIALAAPAAPGAVLQPTHTILASPEATRAFSIVAGLRDLAHKLVGYTDQREYLWGLLLELARRIMLEMADSPSGQRAQIFAAVLCRRLAAWDAPHWLPITWPAVIWADPPSHRREVIEQLFRSIAVAESCSFVGLPSMGKTHLLQHFATRADVQQQYLGDRAAHIALVYVDFNRLHELTTFDLYELLLAALAESSTGPLIGRVLGEELAALHRDVMLNQNALLAQRFFERAVATLCRNELTVCFIFDNFDKAFYTLPTQALDNLRALQSRQWNQLCFVVGLSQAPDRTRPQGSGEAFMDLIAPTVIWLSQYQMADATRALDILGAQYSLALTPHERKKLLWLSGCHPGLLDALFRARWRDRESERFGAQSDDAWLRWGWLHPSVQGECEKIWRVLNESEQRALRAIARGEESDTQAHAILERQGLLQVSDTGAVGMFSPLFAHFVRTQETPDLLRIDRKAVKVWRGEVPLTFTSRLFSVLTLLYEHSGQVCSRDAILAHLYGDDSHNRAPNTVDTQIDRIREVLEPTRPPRYLITVSGQGYKLVGTDIYPSFE